MDFSEKQIAPPISWEKFEDLCLGLFKQIWANPLAVRHGRRGQPQHGVDVYGCPDASGASWHGVQCKGKNSNYNSRPTVRELKEELAKAEKFRPPLERWIFATTGRPDVRLQEAARKLSAQRAKKGKFPIDVLGWDDIQRLIAKYPPVLKEFYPEHSQDLRGIIEQLERITESPVVKSLAALAARYGSAGATTQSMVSPAWLPVTFAPKRDLKPALMGRPLGPADAISCPQLFEAKSLIAELDQAYFVRLVGEAGAGKSICAYQVAHHFSQSGWRVLSLADPSAFGTGLDGSGPKTLYLIDDAHLIPSWILGRAESQATENTILLSTINAQDQSAARPGSIILDQKRAVRTIATELRKNITQTLKLVREVDDRISDDPMSEDLEWRLDNAELTAERPWQFCFILGGGWRRAQQAADNARAMNADIILAVAGLRQIASRDARCSLSMLEAILDKVKIAKDERQQAITWLISQRLLISKNDLRTPHQRFASVVVLRILKGQSEIGQSTIWNVAQQLFQDPAYPLAGLRTLLDELQFNHGTSGHSRVQLEWLDQLYARCWRANDADLPIAIRLIVEISRLAPSGTLKKSVQRHKALITKWLSRPVNQTGYALGDLVYALDQDDKRFPKKLLTYADPVSAANTCSEVNANSAFHIGKYLITVWNYGDEKWRDTFKSTINRSALRSLANTWPATESVYGFAEFGRAVYWMDRSLGLDIVEAFIPKLTAALHRDPVETVHEFDDVLWHVLKGIDLLGIYETKNKQTRREAALCRHICELWDANVIAAKISKMTKRQFQPAAWLLDFAHRSMPDKFSTIVGAIDWSAIDHVVGDGWSNTFHGLDEFLRVASLDAKVGGVIGELIDHRLKDSAELPGRLAILSPGQVIRHLEANRIVRVGYNESIDWMPATIVLARLVTDHMGLAERFLAPLKMTLTTMLSKHDPSFWGHANVFFHILEQFAPGTLSEILGTVQIETARPNWIKGLTSPDDIRRPTALLIEIASRRLDPLGEMARELQALYPKETQPAKDDLQPFGLTET